jgi:hypothetical protein
MTTIRETSGVNSKSSSLNHESSLDFNHGYRQPSQRKRGNNDYNRPTRRRQYLNHRKYDLVQTSPRASNLGVMGDGSQNGISEPRPDRYRGDENCRKPQVKDPTCNSRATNNSLSSVDLNDDLHGTNENQPHHSRAGKIHRKLHRKQIQRQGCLIPNNVGPEDGVAEGTTVGTDHNYQPKIYDITAPHCPSSPVLGNIEFDRGSIESVDETIFTAGAKQTMFPKPPCSLSAEIPLVNDGSYSEEVSITDSEDEEEESESGQEFKKPYRHVGFPPLSELPKWFPSRIKKMYGVDRHGGALSFKVSLKYMHMTQLTIHRN